MTVLWKNAPGLSWWGRRYTDGAVVEECYIYDECFASSQLGSRQDGITCSALTGRRRAAGMSSPPTVTARQPTGKWVGEAEYAPTTWSATRANCPGSAPSRSTASRVYAPRNGFAAVKFDADLDGALFFPCPKGV